MPISGEWTLLEKISRQIRNNSDGGHKNLMQGIGDDCAVIETSPGKYCYITTDISIENVHFRRDLSPAGEIGYKSMISNISDICAMGGESKFAFIALGIPLELDDKYIEDLYTGFLEATAAGGVTISGGDISKSKELTISITLYGESFPGFLPVYRRGAGAGDTIYCTGNLGASRSGLELLLSDKTSGQSFESSLIKRHCHPPCRQPVVEAILETYQPTAMIDISDGFLADLGHICSAGSIGADIDFSLLPEFPGVREYALHGNHNLKELLLQSGEEYELIFTSSSMKGSSVINGIPVTPVGIITEKDILITENGKSEIIIPNGFDHFI